MFNKEPRCRRMHLQRVLHIALASDCSNAPSDTYESHNDSYRYTQTATPQREIASSDALDRAHCDECYSLCDSSYTRTDWIMCMFGTVKAWCDLHTGI